MPKEMIYDEDAKLNIAIQWGKANIVQLCAMRKVPDSDAVTGYAVMMDYRDLSRDEINRLIRHLRKARDQAYGQDE